MPPPMHNPASRMTANPLRPVGRYRSGKVVAEEQSSSDEDESEPEEQEQPARKPRPKTTAQPATVERQDGRDTSEDEEGFFTDDEDEAGVGGLVGPMIQAGGVSEEGQATSLAVMKEVEPEAQIKDEEESDEEEGSSEEESSSEDEPQRKLLRPTFIKKTERKQNGTSGSSLISGASSGIIQDEAAEQEEARRREMADLMIKDKLERDAAARAAGKKSWDDDDEAVGEDVVEDADGVDPDAELAAWKVRELKRLKRDREAIEAHERAIEERERRNGLSVSEREAEDAERLSAQKEEREVGRGKAGFMQQYHHKGAFFQDDETAELLRKRDLMGAKYVDEVKNREALPEYMQIRNMAKLGKKGGTRYKDLRSEDTGRWGEHEKQDRKYGDRDHGIDMRNVDERFQPDRNGGERAGPTGANASIVKERRKRSPSPYEGQEKRPRIDSA